MSLGIDLLNSSQSDFVPKAAEMRFRYNPFMDHMYKSGGVKKRRMEGPYIEFDVINDAPSQRIAVVNGNEYMPGGRTQDAAKGNEYAFMFIDYWDVPTKDLDLAVGRGDIGGIIKKYPDMAVTKVTQDFAQQFLSGGVAGMEGIVTLNEDQNYVGDGGTRKGLLEFAAPANQTNTAHNISASTYSGWRNQYQTISSYATDGRKLLRKCYYDCQKQEQSDAEGDWLFLADEASYDNHVNDLDDKVAIQNRSTAGGDFSPGKVRRGVQPFADGPMMYREPGILVANFSSGSANLGVIYLLHPGSWQWVFAGVDGRTGMFQLGKPYELPEHPMVRTRIQTFTNLFTNRRRLQGVVTGGTQA